MSTPSAPPATPGATPAPWVLDFVLLAAIWGSSFLFMKMGAADLGAFATAGLRVAIAAVFLMLILLSKGQWPLLRQHWKATLVMGVFNSAIPFACFSYALLSISTGLTAILNATTPLFGAVVAWLWLGDRPVWSRMVGLLVGFVGVAMLAWGKASFVPNAQGQSSGVAVLLCLLACLCYALSASAAKRYMKGVPALVSSTGSQIGATLALAPLTLWFWPQQGVDWHAWGAVIALGVVCTGVAYVLYFRLIERSGPARALSVTFAIPVFAILYGVVLLGEAVTVWMVVCGSIILLGTSLSTGLLRLRLPGA
jgi:drug/metabolite transporter (DMT)-like permease